MGDRHGALRVTHPTVRYRAALASKPNKAHEEAQKKFRLAGMKWCVTSNAPYGGMVTQAFLLALANIASITFIFASASVSGVGAAS